MAARFVQVTNDNTLISYEPNNAWGSVPSTSDMFQVGNMGVPISPVLVSTQSGGFSFIFHGIEIIVVVTYLPTTTESEQSPNATCQVDGATINLTTSPSAQNNWAICSSQSLSDGEHTLTFDISNSEAGSSIYFDYILYAPSPTGQLNLPAGASVRIEENDSSIQYTGFSTQVDTGSARLVRAPTQTIAVPFNGEQLTWYGVYSTLVPTSPSSAQYSIDGGTPKQFALSGPTKDGSESTLLNQVLFQTEILPQGPHQLTAMYLGEGAQTALGLAFVVVQNISTATTSPEPEFPVSTPGKSDPASSQTTAPRPTQSSIVPPQGSSSMGMSSSSQLSFTVTTVFTPATSPSSSRSAQEKLPGRSHALVIGIVVGFFSCLAIIIGVLFLRRRRKHKSFFPRRQNKLNMLLSISPYQRNAQIGMSGSFDNILEQSQDSQPIRIGGQNTASEKLPPVNRNIETQPNSQVNGLGNGVLTMTGTSSYSIRVEEEEEMAENPDFRRVSRIGRGGNPFMNDAVTCSSDSLENVVPSNPFLSTQDNISVHAADAEMSGGTTSLPLTSLSVQVTASATIGNDERHTDSGVRLHRQVLLCDETDDRPPPEYTSD